MHSETLKKVMPALRGFALLSCCASVPAHAADVFAPAGTKGTLSVAYLYESAGQAKGNGGIYDPYTWRVKREFSLATTLVAQPGTPLPTMQKLDAAQTADLQSKQKKLQGAATQMAPLVDDIEKIIAKCGDNEACIAQAAQKMGMQRGPAVSAAVGGAQKELAEATQQGSPRYQKWNATVLSGTYLIDESAHISVADPICDARPRKRCTRDETRKGSGDIAQPSEARKNPQAYTGVAAAEFDTVKNTLTVMLPAPLLPQPYTETIATDEPEGTHSVPTPKGPQQRNFFFDGMYKDASAPSKWLTVPLKGGRRDQAGEFIVNIKGDYGNGGKLTVRWNFKGQ